jgi:hypothetical protein
VLDGQSGMHGVGSVPTERLEAPNTVVHRHANEERGLPQMRARSQHETGDPLR